MFGIVRIIPFITLALIEQRKSRLNETTFAPKRQEESGRKSRPPLESF